MKKELSYLKDTVNIPFIISKSKLNFVDIDEEENVTYSLPKSPVLWAVDQIKNEIEENGYFSIGSGNVLITDIITMPDGWPIYCKAIFVYDDYANYINPYLEFIFGYNSKTLELKTMSGLGLSEYKRDMVVNY